MPIIQKWDVPGADYRPPSLKIPEADTFSAEIGKIAGAAAQNIATGLNAYNTRQAHVQAVLDADGRRSQHGVSLEALRDDILSAPLKERLGSLEEGEDPEASVFLTPQPIPKSETMMEDWKAGVETRRKQALEGVSPLAARYLMPHILSSEATMENAMVRTRRELQGKEALGRLKESVDFVHTTLGSKPADLDADGLPIIDPASASGYQNTKRVIEQKIATAAKMRNGLNPVAAEEMRAKEIAHLTKQWAEKQMRKDPQWWADSVEADTNKWRDVLSDTQQAALKTSADAMVTKQRAQEKQDKLIQKETAELELTDLYMSKTLTDVAIQQRARLIGPEKVLMFAAKRVSQDHSWEGDRLVEVRATIEAGAEGANRATIAKFDKLLTDRQMSPPVHDHLTAIVRENIKRKEDIGRADGRETWHREAKVAEKLLTPSVNLAMEKPEIAAVHANYIRDFTRRMKGRPDNDATEVSADILPKYLGQLGDKLLDVRKVYNNALTKPVTAKPDDTVDPTEYLAAQTAAYKKYGVDPATGAARRRNGSFPSALQQELDAIERVKEYTGYVTQATKNAADIKSGAK